MNMQSKINQIFKHHFSSIGSSVRPEQIKVIASVLQANNTLCLMPTGGGKSLCYWISGVALEGITIIISPLTALMDEQAYKLKSLGFKTLTLHSGIVTGRQYRELISLYNGEKPDFIFLSPERVATDGFLEFVLKSIREKIKLITIDEIHCISQWGLDFRPFYKEIPFFLENIFGKGQYPVIIGLTATLNPKDREEICRDFKISKGNVFQSRFLLRNNIQMSIKKVPNENTKDEMFWETIENHKDEKILVYIDRIRGKRSTEELSREATERGCESAFFHSGLDTSKKMEIIDKFKSGEIKIVFATNAFGMGIDIPDIRGVIHYLLPESVEQYYQQIGRVGRDNKPSWAILFYSDKNVQVRKQHFIDKSFPTESTVKESFSRLSYNRIGKLTFSYFEEPDSQSAYHYLLRTLIIGVVGKGIQNIKALNVANGMSLPQFEKYYNTSKSGLLLTVSKKMKENELTILSYCYRWVAERKLTLVTAPSKCLIIESFKGSLPEDILTTIMDEIEEIKQSKHKRFDDFVKILNGYQNSAQFQMEIGSYLGIDKFETGKIHQTLSGDMVRSKSEVIIANILFEQEIPFQYEAILSAPDDTSYCPDFTIEWNGKMWYWEHLGLLDDDDYSKQWKIKKAWYDKFFPDQLITTTESSKLSKNVEKIINELFSL